MIYVEIDFETRSLCDLKVAGAERYSEDFSTEIICASYSVEGPMFRWNPGQDQWALTSLANDPNIIFVAHNAAFEQAIWRNIMVPQYGFPPIPIERWDCTLAACAWKGIPLALDRAGRALQVVMEKDKEGNKLTLSLSKPDKKTDNLPDITPDILERVQTYCDQDVVVEGGIMKRIGIISRQNLNERRVWILDQKINQRGVRLDLDFVRAAQLVIARQSGPLLQEFQKLTGLKKLASPKLKDWCASQGVPVENLQKGYLAELLGSDEDDSDPAAGYESLAESDQEKGNNPFEAGEIPSRVRRALEIRQALGGAAVKKLPRMLACVGYGGRARGLCQYHAAHSGRWGGRLLQPQNFPRGFSGLAPDEAVEAILSGDPGMVERAFGLPALEAVARCLRHALIPDPGKVFLVGDYTQIEARIVLALAGQHDKTALLASGYPVYFDMAEQIYNKPRGTWAVDDKALYKHYKEHQFVQEYTIGKNTILGCGFQMGPATFQRRYCPDQPAAFAERVVETYRKRWAPNVPDVWDDQKDASFEAVEQWRQTEANGVIWKPKDGFMTARLPSGWQTLWYPFPSLGTGRFGDPCWRSMQSKQGKWVQVDMYGGLETENVVQALARGLLCAALDRLEHAGYPVVLTVHDEIIVEVDEDQADLVSFEKLMAEPTQWAADMGIPIAVEGWQGTRYKK